MSIQTQRIAYQIWWMTRATAGDCTLTDLARFTGASANTCRNICMHRGWGNRYRRRVTDRRQRAGVRPYPSDRARDLTEIFA
ncbi:hypothetical protein ACFP4H_21515 [Pseudophaeobacter arcticus]|uniref:hypothetical protein n=1 Tax=Pseudophaeobacter arcticus TaxID=385492 RepID=UPI00040CF204|nr:hypothetical protein [Pseudophaeobacter arcticus]